MVSSEMNCSATVVGADPQTLPDALKQMSLKRKEPSGTPFESKDLERPFTLQNGQNLAPVLAAEVWAMVFSYLPTAQDQKAIDLTCKRFHELSPLTELQKIRQFLNTGETLNLRDFHYADCLTDSFFKRSIRAFLLASVQAGTDSEEALQNKIPDFVSLKIALLVSTASPAAQTPSSEQKVAERMYKVSEALWMAGKIRIGFTSWMNSPPQALPWFWDYNRVKEFYGKLNNPGFKTTIDELRKVSASIKVLLEKTAFKSQCKECDPTLAPLLNMVPRILQTNPNARGEIKDLMRAYCYAASHRNNVELLTKGGSLFNDDYRVVKKVVIFDGLLLKHASERLRSTFDIGLTAVKQNAFAIFCLAPNLQKDQRIIEAALDQNPNIVLKLPKDVTYTPNCARKIRKLESTLRKSVNGEPEQRIAWSPQITSLVQTPTS